MNKRTFATVLGVVIFAGAAVTVSLKPADSYEKMLLKPKDQFCFLCHGDKQKTYNESGHGQFDIPCDMCHNAHGTGIEMMLIQESRDLCYTCHGDMQDHFEKSGHGEADLTCTMCHNPHGTPSEEPKSK